MSKYFYYIDNNNYYKHYILGLLPGKSFPYIFSLNSMPFLWEKYY